MFSELGLVAISNLFLGVQLKPTKSTPFGNTIQAGRSDWPCREHGAECVEKRVRTA